MIGHATEPASLHATAPAASSNAAIRLFLMTNTFETGGGERQFTVLAQNLSAAEFQLHLGCVNARGQLLGQFKDTPQFPLGGSLFGWRSLRTRLKLSRHLRANQIEIAQSFDFYTNLTLIPAARFARVPVVIGSHRQLGDLMTPSQFRAQAAAFRLCDAVVCNSCASAAHLAAGGIDRNKLAVLGNALPVAAFALTSPALPRRPGTLRVGMVARMNAHYKNHAGFLRIAAQVHRQMPEVEFLLAGDGPLRPELEKQAAALGLGASAIFLGDRQDVPAVLASLDVAVLTSDSESLSNFILEAMAASLPVVAYSVGGNVELVGEQTGALINPRNENEFAAAIVRFLSDADLRRGQGASARRFVEQNFGLDQVRRRYEDLYVSLLDRKGRRKPA